MTETTELDIKLLREIMARTPYSIAASNALNRLEEHIDALESALIAESDNNAVLANV
jgi:hypothetical protein